MNNDSMKKLGWSQELIDSVNKIKTIVDKGAVNDKIITESDFFKIISTVSTSINTSLSFPAGNSQVGLKS
ncbi:MAG: hypothetical protein Q7U10_07930 [Thermodesulfovibrionia bacterium]|nr:hypothetical protein [Thermodesulfovibrionia bacterium]